MEKSKIRIFRDAQKKKIAIGQFNFSDISQFKAILSAAKKTKKTFIFGTSESESKFLTPSLAVKLRDIAEKELGFPVILNLDHGKSFSYIKKAIEAGYDMVHFDGSNFSLKTNIKRTKEVVIYAKKKGVIIEGELGYLRGGSFLHKNYAKIKKEDLTSPDEADFFVKETKVDGLAVVIGNIHGVWAKMPHLDLDRLNMIKNKVGARAFLVLHGGSGISKKSIKKAIQKGIRKININTEIRIAWRKGLEKTLNENKKEVIPYKLSPTISKEIEKVVLEKINLFNNS